MKIISWNCNMVYRKKAGHILAENPDIVIIQECEHPDKLIFETELLKPTGRIWFGDNRTRGLCVFSYNNYHLKLLDCHNPDLKTILPITVTGGTEDFTLFATWAYNDADKNYKYVGQVMKAIKEYSDILIAKKCILIGDLNSNSIWDAQNKYANHTMMVDELAKINITSAYHHYHTLNQGIETHPTFYLYRHRDKPFHIDYCFASQYFIDRLETIEIGEYEDWKGLSDHMPVKVVFGKAVNNIP